MTSLLTVSEYRFDDEKMATVDEVTVREVPAGADPVEAWTALATFYLKDEEGSEEAVYRRNDETDTMEALKSKPDGRSFVSFVQHLPNHRIRSVSLIPDLESV